MERDRLSRDLSEQLEAARMTAEALSLRAHLARDTVGRWIRGTTVPTLVALRAVEGVLSSRLGYEADLSAAVRERRSARQRDQLPALPLPHPEPAYRATLREFGRALHQRMPQLLGRDRELAEIAAFATGREGYRRLVGGAFAGKTALLYEAVTAGLPETVDVVCYFLSRRASDASSDRFLATVVPQLDYLCGVADPGEPRDRFRALWEQAADRAMQSGRYLLLVVDGLDEDLRPPGSPSVASLLPALAGGRAHVLVSSRPRPELPDDVPGGHPLGMTPTPLVPFEGAQELADLAKKEINDLTRGDDAGPAVDVLGLLTAAAGELSVRDLVALQSGGEGAPTAADSWRVRRLVEDRAARSLERVGSPGSERYRFAHDSLLEYAITVPGLCDPEYRQRIHRWAERWRDVGWPVPAGGDEGTPRYLLGTYPSTLIDDPRRLAQLVSDIGWVEAAARTAGVDLVLANLRAADATNPASAVVAGVLATVTGQAHNLRPPQPLDQAGYILRQLWMQAAELAENDLADGIRSRLQSRPGVCLMPRWTTRRASRALAGELGRHDSWVNAVAVLDDGRVVTGGSDNRVLLWEPARPETSSTELGRHNETVSAVAALPDGRVVTAGHDMRVLVWDPARPGAGPVELGRSWVGTVAVLPDGRVVTGGSGLDVLVWDPARPGAGPVELGRSGIWAVAVLPDGRVVTGGQDGRVLVWDPARPGAGPAELGRRALAVGAVAVLADGRVVTGGFDGRVLVWDPARPGVDPVELGRHGDEGVDAVAVLPDGRVVTGWRDGRVLVWDPARSGVGPVELGRHDDWVRAVAVLRDGRVVTGGEDGRVLVWDPARPEADQAELGQYEDLVNAVAVLDDGRVVTVTGGYHGRVLVWDPARPGAGPAELGWSRYDWVLAVTALADGRIATGSRGGQVLIWDPARPGTGPAELGHHEDWVPAVAALADGRIVTGGHDGRVLVWDPARRRGRRTKLGHHDGGVLTVAVLADGRVVTGGLDGRVLMWDPAHPRAHPAELGRHEAAKLGRDESAELDGDDEWRQDYWVEAMAALTDGRVVSGGIDGRVLMWDPARPGTGPAELGRHDTGVEAVAVLADGRVVTGGRDGRVLVRDPTGTSARAIQLNCSVTALATAPRSPANGVVRD